MLNCALCGEELGTGPHYCEAIQDSSADGCKPYSPAAQLDRIEEKLDRLLGGALPTVVPTTSGIHVADNTPKTFDEDSGSPFYRK